MRIHVIGIGGIGVSALAQYYLEKGHEVSGSDLARSELTDFLETKGIRILIGNKVGHITADINTVIYSPAVKHNNPEMLQAISFKLQVKSYPEALGELTKDYYTIAINATKVMVMMMDVISIRDTKQQEGKGCLQMIREMPL